MPHNPANAQPTLANRLQIGWRTYSLSRNSHYWIRRRGKNLAYSLCGCLTDVSVLLVTPVNDECVMCRKIYRAIFPLKPFADPDHE